jgi:hypothetical protein
VTRPRAGRRSTAGDTFEYSVFAVTPQVYGRTVQDGERRTTVSADAVAQVAGG